MKKYMSTLIGMLLTIAVFGQGHDTLDAIKLFVDEPHVVANNPDLGTDMAKRLYSKTIQIINKTGVAEIGYSNFLVIPVFTIINTELSEVGIAKLHMVTGELALYVTRRDYSNDGAASYDSYVKTIVGSGNSEAEAIANAINGISSNDKELVNFLKQARVKIHEYFKNNCEDVLIEARQSYELGFLAKSIALYFSIPPTAGDCYEQAVLLSKEAYESYLDEKCHKDLVEVEALVGQLIKNGRLADASYNKIMTIISETNIKAHDCFNKMKGEVAKLHQLFSEQQQREWDLLVKKVDNDHEAEMKRLEDMRKISQEYHDYYRDRDREKRERDRDRTPETPSNQIIIVK